VCETNVYQKAGENLGENGKKRKYNSFIPFDIFPKNPAQISKKNNKTPLPILNSNNKTSSTTGGQMSTDGA
jgi:hypothetical protein